jgi:hypothetical protein
VWPPTLSVPAVLLEELSFSLPAPVGSGGGARGGSHLHLGYGADGSHMAEEPATALYPLPEESLSVVPVPSSI